MTHGEAVALGMRAMLRLSECRHGLANAELDRAERFLNEFGFPQLSKAMLDDSVLEFIQLDKKRKGEHYRLIFLSSLGVPFEEELDWITVQSLFGSLKEHPFMEA